MRTHLSLLILALAASSASATTSPTGSVEPSCEVRLKVQNALGNFEIQDLVVELDEVKNGAVAFGKESHTLPLRLPAKAQATVMFTIRSGCATKRTLKVRRVRKDSGDAHLDYIMVPLPTSATSATSVGAVVRIDR